MEPIGFAISVVSLYNVTIDLLHRVRNYEEFGLESQATLLTFDASRLKLENWAKALGISGGKLLDTHDPRLDDPQIASVVKNVLHWLMRVFAKVLHISSSLKLPQHQRVAGVDGWSLPTDDVGNESGQRQASSLRSRLAWAAGGKSKLTKDVRAFEGLVNILNEVVP